MAKPNTSQEKQKDWKDLTPEEREQILTRSNYKRIKEIHRWLKDIIEHWEVPSSDETDSDE